MPTLGWIQEDAEERFWDSQPVPVLIPDMTPLFFCPRCGEEFPALDDLRRHLSGSHPLELPSLYVLGKPLLRDAALRSPLTVGDVELVQCSRCEVQIDGGQWQELAPAEFCSRFAQPTNSTWNVRLLHDRSMDGSRAQAEYRVRFRIADAEVLSAVDEHFIRTLVLDDVAHSDLERFGAVLTLDAPEREYATALGDYALGVVLKERNRVTHARVNFGEFASKMRSAHETLRHYHRPVALAVCACIRFNLNDFGDYGTAIPAELEPSFDFFLGVAGANGDVPLRRTGARSWEITPHRICPIDQVSYRLSSMCAHLDRGDEFVLADLEELGRFTGGIIPVSEYDYLKIHAICAEGFLRLARADDADPHLRALQFDPAFGAWARHRLEEITAHAR